VANSLHEETVAEIVAVTIAATEQAIVRATCFDDRRRYSFVAEIESVVYKLVSSFKLSQLFRE